MSSAIKLWSPPQGSMVPKTAHTPKAIIAFAVQLTEKDKQSLVKAYSAASYEMASTFVWSKAMSALKKQLASLGMEFVGEMLNRSDIDENTPIDKAVTEWEAIQLSSDLGMFTSTESLRLRQAFELVRHFSDQSTDGDDDAAEMTREEAINCLRACVQGILGQQNLSVAEDFAKFRKALSERDFKQEDDAISSLTISPYIFKKTTLSVLLATIRSSLGAELEHALANVNVILPAIWSSLRKPERWQTGQTYSLVHAEGRNTAASGLKKALLAVRGFDYVPETLRSSAYLRAAGNVLEAHEGFNNFYNEPAPMRVLASLGTAIPMPAFPVCMSAAVSVYLGNPYGVSRDAQSSVEQFLKEIAPNRWEYFLDECLPTDVRLLSKLLSAKPRNRWVQLVGEFKLADVNVKHPVVKSLISASKSPGKPDKLDQFATRLLSDVSG